VLTKTNAKNETTTYGYDVKGYLTSIDGPLPGGDDTTSFTYDSHGRVSTRTDESGYTLTFDYDPLDRVIKITYPDATFDQFSYTLLDRTLIRDRAERQTSFAYNGVQQMTKRTDPLNRTTLYQWCKCGDLKGLTDPMGRTTTWGHDVQGRLTHKQYVDGSRVTYRYEQTTGRMIQRIDEKGQVTQYNYNRDETVSEISYANAAVTTPTLSYTYDPNYSRVVSMKDGTGLTLYSYYSIARTPGLGAGKLASINGPLPDDTITYAYDELGRTVARGINGVPSSVFFDAANRVTSETNALGTFDYEYDGPSRRRSSVSYPNGLTSTFDYHDNLKDQRLRRIAHTQGLTPISEFSYGYDVPAYRITTWEQKSGTQDPIKYDLSYDDENQLRSVSGTQSGNVTETFAYTYDPSGNRLTEEIDGTTNQASYNALNQLTTKAGDPGAAATYEWDAEQRLTAIISANERTEFAYDGLGHRVGIRQLVDDSEVSKRRFVWCNNEICEERTPDGSVSKRFFAQGMKVERSAAIGNYFYTRDHLGSIRELIDMSGTVRARYAYGFFGRQKRTTGDFDSEFGFANMCWSRESNLNLTQFRAYDPTIGRWLSRDPLKNTEFEQGYNLYIYAVNDPVNRTDPSGLSPHPVPDPLEDLSACMSRVPFGNIKGLFCCMFPTLCEGPKPGSAGPGGGGPSTEECNQIRRNAIKECTHDVLENKCYPPSNNEMEFRNCINEIMRHAGCLG